MKAHYNTLKEQVDNAVIEHYNFVLRNFDLLIVQFDYDYSCFTVKIKIAIPFPSQELFLYTVITESLKLDKMNYLVPVLEAIDKVLTVYYTTKVTYESAI